jgi:hypothetical protein
MPGRDKEYAQHRVYRRVEPHHPILAVLVQSVAFSWVLPVGAASMLGMDFPFRPALKFFVRGQKCPT